MSERGTTTVADELAQSIAAGERWLLAHVDPEGAPAGDVGHSYRLPYTLVLLGRRQEAARVLAWMQREILTEDGDLAAGPMRAGFSERWSSYPLAIIAQAAWHLERYGLAHAILGRLRDFQHPDHGGAFAERPELRRTGRQDLFPTAQLGMTAILTGNDDMAAGAFSWISELYTLQPQLPEMLYSATDGEGALLVDVPEPDDGGRERFGLITDLRRPRQAFYNPGIAAAFLARYADRYGSKEAAQLAGRYLELTENATAQQFDHRESVQVCKFGWGAANLYQVTGDVRFEAHAQRMARWFIEAQSPDGSWDNSPFLLPEGPTTGSRLEVTAEFVQHQIVIATALATGARDA